MPNIRLKNINNFICRDINLEIRDREFLVIWGPTGAGKTTLLNIIAGLYSTRVLCCSTHTLLTNFQ